MQLPEELEKLLPPGLVGKIGDGPLFGLVVPALGQGQIIRPPLLHQAGEQSFEHVHVLDDRSHHIGVKGQGLLQVLKNSHEIQDKAAGLHQTVIILIRAVDPGNGLRSTWSRMGLSRYMQ